MKKLMIAAAIAAMIGGAQADFVYDFSASVKTTKAKIGGSTSVTVKYSKNAAGKFWYNDDVFLTGGALAGWVKWDKSGVGKLAKTLNNDEKTTLAYWLTSGSTDAPYDQPDYYKGKEKWCLTLSYKVSGICYRVAGSEKITAKYGIDDCCGTTTFTELTTVDVGGTDTKILEDLDTVLLYRFGGQTYAKSTKVEFVGKISDPLSSTADIPGFVLAGQGDWGKLTAKDKTTAYGIKSISGNIVGIYYDPLCEVCCGLDDAALVYSCDGTSASLNVDDSTQADGIYSTQLPNGVTTTDWGTAAFGTFTLKFNAKDSTL